MAGAQPSRVRYVVFYILVVLFTLGYGVLMSLGLGLLGPAWDAGGSAYIHRIHHLAAAVFIALLVIGLVAQLYTPERQIAAFQQAVLAIVAMQITAVIIGDPDNHGGNVGVIDPVMLILVVPIVILAALHPARRELLRLHVRVKPVSAAIAVLSAIPLVLYGVNQALLQRNSWPPAADPHHNGHWMAMAMLAFAIPLIGLSAAIRRDDWGIPAWSAGTAAILFGLGSALMPELASSVGRAWGSISIIGGVLFVGVVTWEARHAKAALTSALAWQLPRH